MITTTSSAMGRAEDPRMKTSIPLEGHSSLKRTALKTNK